MRKGERFRPPPMDTLEAFVVAARLGSFSAAAEALNLTPSAISRQIGALEQDLGVALFARGARGVTLTPAGDRLHPAAVQALSLVLDAARELRRRKGGAMGREPVRISVTPSFGARWLMPRLPHFQAAHPDVEVVVAADLRLVTLSRERFDFAVRYAAAIDQPGLESTLWLREELVPVGAPSLLNGRGRTPAELIRLPLLHDSSEAFWRYWFAAADLPDHPEPTGAIFNDYNLAVGAAVSGLGLLLGRTGLLDQELGDGRLIEATELRAPSPRAYHLVRRAGVLKPAAAALWDWLLPQGNMSF